MDKEVGAHNQSDLLMMSVIGGQSGIYLGVL